ncbi:MAG TPA: DNA-processing protein DprA [Steroidobacteraceae bacterium]|nr:DNA-processing protein DprA [Steroidobacteraceae bacterium]
MDTTAIRAVLARTPGLNIGRLRSLIQVAGLEHALEPYAIAEADLPTAAREYLSSPDTIALQADLHWIERSGACLILADEPPYPPLLARIASPPPVLFVLGDASVLLESRQIAIVGARNPTPGGRATALDFAAQLSRAGAVITSGMAVGIDAASHEGALAAGGRTVAVCATGLDQIYPRQHARLADRIRERGALVSEFPPRTPPRRQHFPRRNRLISGLSAGTLVVEAALASGSLQTAGFAARQGRKVLAIPGSIRNPLASGCHELIRSGAQLVQTPAQVLSALKFSLTGEGLASDIRPVGRGGPLDNPYEMLLDALALESATVDMLAERTGMTCASVASMLLILELEGRVAPHPGGRYGPLH